MKRLMAFFGLAGSGIRVNYGPESSVVASERSTDFSHVFPLLVQTSQNSFIRSLTNHIGIALGLQHAFKAFLISCVVFAEYDLGENDHRAMFCLSRAAATHRYTDFLVKVTPSSHG